jgi:hypothetical protein
MSGGRLDECLDDAVAGERFGADMRQLFERFLAPPRRAADPLSQTNERVDDEGGARQADHRKAGVDEHEQRGVGDKSERFSRQVARGLGDDLLDLRHVVADAGHELAGRPLREEPGRLTQNVSIQRVSEIHDDALSDVGHQVRGDVRADAFQRVGRDDEPGDQLDALLIDEDVIDDVLDEIREARRAGGVDDHAQDRPREAAAVRPGVLKEAVERCRVPHKRAVSRYPSGCDRCHSHAVRTIVSSSGSFGVQPRAVRALSGAAYRTAGSPARRGAKFQGTF